MLRAPMTQAATRLMLASKKSSPICTRPEVVAADQLLRDRLELVGENHHVVAVPANAPADVQQDLVQIHEHRRDLVRDDLGRMVMAGVQAQELLAREGVAEVKLVRADDVALRADAEQLALDGVAVVLRVDRLGEDRVERFGEPLARALAVDRAYPCEPSGIQTLVTQGDPSALPIAAPMRRQAIPWSIQNWRMRLIGVGQGVAVGRQRVGEIGRVEVHADLAGTLPSRSRPGSARARARRARPSGPRSRRSWRGGSGGASPGKSDSVLSRSDRSSSGVRALPGIMAGDRQAAAQLLAGVLEPADVVALPAMERDRDRRQPLEGRIDIDAPFRVLLFRTGEGLFQFPSAEVMASLQQKASMTRIESRPGQEIAWQKREKRSILPSSALKERDFLVQVDGHGSRSDGAIAQGALVHA